MDTDALYATFTLGPTLECAIDINQIREATQFSGDLIEIPSSPDFVEGIMNLRGELIPIINLKRRLNFSEHSYDTDCRVAVLELGGHVVGVLFDGIRDVLKVSEEEIVAVSSEILGGDDHLVKSIISKDEGRRVLQVVNLNELIGEESTDKSSAKEAAGAEQQLSSRHATKTARAVVFSDCGLEYGLPIESVREIANLEQIDETFKADSIAGTMMLHGAPIPVVSFRDIITGKDPSLAGKTQDAQTKALIIEIEGTALGAMVSGMREILSYHEDEILPVRGASESPVDGIIHADEKRDVVMINCHRAFASVSDAASAVASLGGSKVKKNTAKDEGVEHYITKDSYLLVKIDRLFAIPLSRTQEILPVQETLPIPGMMEYMRGVINLRGTVVPVVSMRHFLGYPPADTAEEERHVIAEYNGLLLALQVDRIESILNRHKTYQTPTLNNQLRNRLSVLDRLIKSQADSTTSILVVNIPNLMDEAAVGER